MLVSLLTSEFEAAASWEEFVTSFRGESYLSPNLEHLDHPAGPLLCEWRDHKVPAQTSSELWPIATRDACVVQGCHRSAVKHTTFLQEEMAEFIDNRFWVVLPYKLVGNLPIVPKGLYPRPDLLTLWTSNRIRALGPNQDVGTHLVER
jgi:hypothetical protein